MNDVAIAKKRIPAVLVHAGILFTAIHSIAFQFPPEFAWARRAGSESGGECRALGVACAPSGEVSVTGFFSGTASFGSTNIVCTGFENMFVARYDGAGNLLWVRKAGGASYDEGRAVVVDASGNTFVAGFFQGTAAFGSTNVTSVGESDMFLAKYSSSGTLLWVRKAGGTDFDEAHGLALDASGDVYLTGYFNLKATFGALNITNLTTSNQLFVAKCNASGAFVWARRAGGSADIEGTALTVDGNTNVFVTGSFAGSANFGSTNLLATGSNGLNDIFVARYDGNGNLLWVRQAGGMGEDEPAAIAADRTGHVGVIGRFSGSAAFSPTNLIGAGMDIFVARYDADGNLLWACRAGGNNSIYGDAGLAAAMDASNQLVVSGFFSGNASFGATNLASSGFQDVFVAAYQMNGDLSWIRKAGGPNLDVGSCLAVDTAGSILLAGFFSGTAAYGNTTLTSGSGGASRDMFVAKLAGPPPSLSASKSLRGILLTWPAASDFKLQYSHTLPPAGWLTDTSFPSIVGAFHRVEWTNTLPQNFFRLTKP